MRSWRSFVACAGLALSTSVVLASCHRSVEGFCESWVEDACTALAGCCGSGTKFDPQACRHDLSRSCQSATDTEGVHTGEVKFDSGAASDCLTTIKACGDIGQLGREQTYDQMKACSNMLTGYLSPGDACSSNKDCASAGDFSTCYEGFGYGGGICAKVVLDDATCSFSYDTLEYHVCGDDKFCDMSAFKPKATDTPEVQGHEFSLPCRPRIGAGGDCSKGKVCALGLICKQDKCAPQGGVGSSCYESSQCAPGLVCDGSKCASAQGHGEFCYKPAKCGDGKCEQSEVYSCPADCGGYGGASGYGGNYGYGGAGDCYGASGDPCSADSDCCSGICETSYQCQ